MDILLDTHIWLWSFLDHLRIGKHLAAMLEDPANQLWLSPVSLWEAMVLSQNGSIELAPDPATWLRHSLRRGFVLEAAITHEVAIHSRLIDLPHKDPVDRFIAATALVNNLSLATADKHLLRCRGIRTLPNR